MLRCLPVKSLIKGSCFPWCPGVVASSASLLAGWLPRSAFSVNRILTLGGCQVQLDQSCYFMDAEAKIQSLPPSLMVLATEPILTLRSLGAQPSAPSYHFGALFKMKRTVSTVSTHHYGLAFRHRPS